MWHLATFLSSFFAHRYVSLRVGACEYYIYPKGSLGCFPRGVFFVDIILHPKDSFKCVPSCCEGVKPLTFQESEAINIMRE